MKFIFIEIGEDAGSDIKNIFHVWEEQGSDSPVITESYEPDLITLSLAFKSKR